MSGSSPPHAAMADAAQSLRDTAKWLAGGVVASAAGVFAGSSLTSLGALDPVQDRTRLLLAIGGLLLGFAGLAALMEACIRTLTRDSLTLRELSEPRLFESTDVSDTRHQLERRYRARFPSGVVTLAGYRDRVDAAQRDDPGSAATLALLARSRDDTAMILADGAFLLVRRRFDRLMRTMRWATMLAVAGFGLFAWAANPPRKEPPPAALSIVIRGWPVR